MPISNSGVSCLYSLLGIVIMIAALAVLGLAVTLVRRLTDSLRSKRQEEPDESAAQASAEAAPDAPAAEYPAATAGTLKLKHVDDRTAALLMAIVCDKTSIPLNQLRFKSIVCLNP